MFHGFALSTFLLVSQELFVEKTPTFVDALFVTVPAPMATKIDEAERRRRFSEYIQHWMKENNQRTPKEVQDRSRKEGPGISDALISKFLNGEKEDCNVSSIVGLADGLLRPPDEVLLAFLGKVAPINLREYKESDMAHIWQLCKALPNSERKPYARLIKMMYADIVRVTDSLKPE